MNLIENLRNSLSTFTTASEKSVDRSRAAVSNAAGAKADSFKKASAFTLIELLVVIAIIGILSSVVLASLNGARESARDARRQQDINQIRTAIELYINDNGQPPFAGNDEWYSSASDDWSTGPSNLAAELQPYISPLPIDPVNNGSDFLIYSYRAGGATLVGDVCEFTYPEDSYTLHVSFEGDTSPDNLQLASAPRNRYCLVQ